MWYGMKERHIAKVKWQLSKYDNSFRGSKFHVKQQLLLIKSSVYSAVVYSSLSGGGRQTSD